MRAAMRVANSQIKGGSLMNRRPGTKPHRADTWAAHRDNTIEQSPFQAFTTDTVLLLLCPVLRTRYLASRDCG
jgi:hypothetical protein